MESSGKKLIAIIVSVVLLAGALIGAGIYVGGHLIDQQKQEQAAREEAKAEEEAKQKVLEEAKASARAEEERKEAALLAEQETKRQQEEAQKAAALAQAEQLKTAGGTVGLADVNSYAVTYLGIQPQENQDESQVLPDTAGAPNGHQIAIDPGHQAHGNSEQEPIGPGAGETKAKVASGTYGASSGLNEYELNLMVSLKLKDELVRRGYGVYMVRETHDVDISNAQRAQAAAQSGSEILVRIHANGLDDSSVHGALTMAPMSDNPYLSQSLIAASQSLSQTMIDQICAATGAKNLGVQQYNNMSGINWSTIPVTIVEMGFMSNADEDLRMATEDYQAKMVQGIANGIDAYFNGQ